MGGGAQPTTLGSYLSAHHRRWLARADGPRHEVVEGTLLFVDISGFTPLTERLARGGKAGAEELTDHLNVVFGELIALAARHGGDVLKFGGDALFILLHGSGHEARGGAAAWDLQIGMARYKRLRTSVGTVALCASAGLASGPVHLFRAGSAFDELVVAGPTVTTCLALEKSAEATEILVDPVAAAGFGGVHCAITPDRGLLLVSRPDAGAAPPRDDGALVDPRRGLPSILHDELQHSELGEHRQGAVSFVQFRGVDELLASDGPAAVSHALDAFIGAVQSACERHGVTFIATDADLAAGKVMLAAGAPLAHEDDADRMLLAVCEIVAHDGPLDLRAGVNGGRVFAVHLGARERRTYSTMGDTTNLAARVMGKAPKGCVLATRAVLDRTRGHFAVHPVTPFMVKGKSQPVEAAIVDGPAGSAASVRGDSCGGDRSVPPGRDREAAALAAAARAAAAGRVTVVELVGEPGIGKSRLVAHATAVAHGEGLRTVRLEGTAYGSHTPYAAMREPLRGLLGAADGDDAAVQYALARAVTSSVDWLGLLGPLVGIDIVLSARAARLGSDAAARRRRHVAAQLLSRLLDDPTLLVVEDAHWLDAATSELLATMLAGGRLRSCAVVCARRPDLGGFVVPDDLAPQRLALAPLSDIAARTIVVAAIQTGGRLTPDAVPALVARAGGNPLLLRELAAAVGAGGDLTALPATIEGLLAASIDRLAPADRVVLRRLAVLGTSSDFALAATYLGMTSGELHEIVARLDAFVEVASGRMRFRQTLHHAAAYEALPFRVRRDLHARAGDVTAAAVDGDLDAVIELLALHAHHARRLADCWRYARRAGRRALSRGAPSEAIALYDWAIEAGRRLPEVDASALGEVLEERGDAAERAGRYDDASKAYAAARRDRRADPLVVAELWRKQARMHERRGRYDLALGCATRGRRALRDVPQDERSDVTLARLEDVSGVARLRQGNAAAARTHLSAAVARLERTTDACAIAHASYSLAGALVELGEFDDAERLSTRALELYEEVGDLVGASTVLNNQGIDAYWTGDWQRAERLLQSGRDMRRELGDVALTAESELNLAELWSDQGRWEDAERLLADALAIFRAAPRPEGIGLATSDLGRLAARRGDVERARALLADARARLESIGAAGLAYEVGVREAERLVLAAQPDAALRAVAKMRVREREVHASHFYRSALVRTEGWAAAQRGERERARTTFGEALQIARTNGLRYDEVVTLDAIDHLSGGTDEAARAAPAALRELGIVALARPPLDQISTLRTTGDGSRSPTASIAVT